jgi:hypothetical protein
LKFVAASAPPSWWGLFVEAPDAASAIEEAIRRYDIRQPLAARAVGGTTDAVAIAARHAVDLLVIRLDFLV